VIGLVEPGDAIVLPGSAVPLAFGMAEPFVPSGVRLALGIVTPPGAGDAEVVTALGMACAKALASVKRAAVPAYKNCLVMFSHP
jgi:hypothetical protein